MKAIVICNNNVALPAIQYMAQSGVLTAVATISDNHELCGILSSFSEATGIELKIFGNKDFVNEMNTWLDNITPDVVLMMTWPYKIHESALCKPKLGFVNFHYGLLPYYRGVNPVFEQIRKREKTGGITVHHADAGIDTGPVILQQTVPIQPGDSFGMHMNNLSYAGAEAVKTLISMIRSGRPLPAFPQDDGDGVYYQKPGHKDVSINWQEMEAEDIIALVNACNPWNYGAATSVNNNMIGILDAVAHNNNHEQIPGTILEIDNDGLTVCCKNNKVLKIPMVYTAAGFIRPVQLLRFGLNKGLCFS